MITKLRFQFNLLKISLFIIAFAASVITKDGNASEKYALLIGVSNYPSLPENRQLPGAKNDVLLMRNVLGNIGFHKANITLLADNVDGTSTPTRKAILTALDEIRDKSLSGDFVYLHFSGHGSQQPILDKALAAKETDGLDEIFLPADIGRWDGKIGTVRNAIIDNEFEAAITAIRQKGVFVWTVFDTCHAGTLNRGLRDTLELSREVAPLELGIPAKLMGRVLSARRGITPKRVDDAWSGNSSNNANSLGAYIAFYASQSDQITTETKFKVGDHFAVHGTFTFAIAQTINAKPKLSYRELSQQILNQYATHNRFFPTPLFEGAQLDARILNESKITQQNQWPVQRSANGDLIIPIGSLHQINENSLFALVEDPSSESNEIKVNLKIKSISTLDTDVIAIDAKTGAEISMPPITTGVYARLIRPGLQNRINIAFDEDDFPPTTLMSLNKNSQGIQRKDVEIHWIKKSNYNAADFELISDRKSMCLLVIGKPQTCKAKSAWFPTAPNSQKNIQTITARAKHLRKVNNLLVVAEQFTGHENLEKFDIKLYLTPKNSTKTLLINRAKWEQVRVGDKLKIVMQNATTRSIDASLIFIDSVHNIQAVFPNQRGEVNRIEPQGRHEIKLDITSETLGIEKLIAILAEARPHSMMQDFSFLADAAPMRINRGEGNTLNPELGALLSDPIFTNHSQSNGEMTRSAEGSKAVKVSSQSAVRIFSWVVK